MLTVITIFLILGHWKGCCLALQQKPLTANFGLPAGTLVLGAGLPAGTLVLGAGLLFSLRSVRSVMLQAGGKHVTLTTHAPFGLGAHFTVPLNQVSCMAHRGEVPAMLPLKIKGRRFYFLLDKAGHFPNTKLFDNTVGAYRSL